MKILAKITFIAVFGFTISFAQELPEKLAVYVSGAGDAGINKSLSGKLLVAMSQSGKYVEIGDLASFQDELAKSGKSDIPWIAQTAKRHGADYVCSVNMTELLGAYSFIARLIKVADFQVIKTGSTDRQIKSLEDLTAVSNELAHQLLPPSTAPPAVSAIPLVVLPSTAPMPAVIDRVECARTYNINELLFKIKDGFPTQLKDCSSTLAKDMLTPASFGGKKLEPKSFMMQCPIDGIKKELPEGFPNADKILGSITNFVQGILNNALAGGALDPKKLPGAVASMNIMELLNDIKKLSADECVVDEPYTPPALSSNSDDDENYSKEEKSSFSFGLRGGLNTSLKRNNFHIGMVFDIPLSEVIHLQPGFMFIQKTPDWHTTSYNDKNILELPLLLSFKFGVFRINTGSLLAYMKPEYDDGSKPVSISLNNGIGFDIGMFYIGAFYESFFSTLGFSLGINL